VNEDERPEGIPENGEIDCGEPVAELAELREFPSAEFADRVRRGIGRRRLAAEMTQASIQMPFLWLMEILDLLFHFFTGKITKKGGPNSG